MPVYKEITTRKVEVLKLLPPKREWWMADKRHYEEMSQVDHKLNMNHRKYHCDIKKNVMLKINNGS